MNYSFQDFIMKSFSLRYKDGKYYIPVYDLEVIDIDCLLEDVAIVEEKDLILTYEQDNHLIAEVATSLRSGIAFRNEEDEEDILNDNDNGLKYELSKGSFIYSLWLAKKVYEKYNENLDVIIRRMRGALKSRIRMVVRRFSGEESNENKISMYELLQIFTRVDTLKVTKDQTESMDLKTAIESYNYTYMCNTNSALKVYNIEDIFTMLRRGRNSEITEFTVPKRKYNSRLVDYYNLALSTEDPFVSFISYYHIIEYFYDEVFREQQISILREKITSPRFNYKSDEQVFNVIEQILKVNRNVKDNGSGNEQQSLNYVLNKYIDDIVEFKDKIDNESLNFYQNNIVRFSHGDVIDWTKDIDKVIKSVSNRIYKTRNSLIHSKSSKKDVTYHPYLHKDELHKEIDLIKAIAESIIEKSSECL